MPQLFRVEFFMCGRAFVKQYPAERRLSCIACINKDRYVASFELTGDVLGSPLRIVEHGSAPLPLGVHDEDFAAWLDSRKASRHNGRFLRLMRELGCDRLEGFIAATHAASLIDIRTG